MCLLFRQRSHPLSRFVRHEIAREGCGAQVTEAVQARIYKPLGVRSYAYIIALIENMQHRRTLWYTNAKESRTMPGVVRFREGGRERERDTERAREKEREREREVP